MENFVYHNPTKIIFGKDQISQVGAETAAIGKKALLLTGGASVKKSGLYDKVLASLNEACVTVLEQSGIVPNPVIESVRKGATLCKNENIEIVLAVGGGSVIDTAKAIAAGATCDGDPWDFFKRSRVPEKPTPVGTILTLSATGSEANGNTVISNPETGEKRPFYHSTLFPRFSILDPAVTFTVPKNQTANGAIDILSHVFEQYFHNVKATPLQDGIAETIMRTVIANAPIAMEKPDDYDARANLMWSSTLALNGLLVSGAKGDWASHMIGHELSAKYGLAHGEALAIVFPNWMKRVYKINIAKFAKFAVNVWGLDKSTDAEELALGGIEATKRFFMETLGAKITLGEHAIDGSRIDEMAESAMGISSLGSLVTFKKSDLVKIYESCL
ncbi:NADH-dependent butanol dehydrogenase A [hydrothermal vent metagenome]|uniref:NADH-dependent butanol dehydrogenase A n=1 Tax=hydrothermal vent metagenome TaxID=652676 RepID=A0A3B1CD87_9ZZZZ